MTGGAPRLVVNQVQGHSELTSKTRLAMNMQVGLSPCCPLSVLGPSRAVKCFAAVSPRLQCQCSLEVLERRHMRRRTSWHARGRRSRSWCPSAREARGSLPACAAPCSAWPQAKACITSLVSHQPCRVKHRPVQHACARAGRVWITKPGGRNRGRGIEVFDSMRDIERHLASQPCADPAPPA